MKIYVEYYTGKNGNYKESKRVFNNFVALYNNLNTFKNIKCIKIHDTNKGEIITINGHYNIIDYVNKIGGCV